MSTKQARDENEGSSADRSRELRTPRWPELPGAARAMAGAYLQAPVPRAGRRTRAVLTRLLAIALSVDPCNELLHRDAIAAAHRAGDTAEVDRLVAVLQHRIDPDDGLEDETSELLDRVRTRQT